MPIFSQTPLDPLRLSPDLLIEILNLAITRPHAFHQDPQAYYSSFDYASNNLKQPERKRRADIRASIRKRQVMLVRMSRVCKTFYGTSIKALWEYLAPKTISNFHTICKSAELFPIRDAHGLRRGQKFGALCHTLDLSDMLSFCDTAQRVAAPETFSSHFPNIKTFASFEIRSGTFVSVETSSKAIAVLQNLWEWAPLEVLYQINAEGERNLERSLSVLPRLRVLELSKGTLNDRIIKALSSMKGWTPGLQGLIFSDDAKVSWQILLDAMSALPQLKMLDVRIRPQLGLDNVLKLRSFVERLPSGLQHLSLSKQSVPNVAVAGTLDSLVESCPGLKTCRIRLRYISYRFFSSLLSLCPPAPSSSHSSSGNSEPNVRGEGTESTCQFPLHHLSLSLKAAWERNPTQQGGICSNTNYELSWNGKEDILTLSRLVTEAVGVRNERFDLNLLKRATNFMKTQNDG